MERDQLTGKGQKLIYIFYLTMDASQKKKALYLRSQIQRTTYLMIPLT